MPDILDAHDRISNAVDGLDCLLDLLSSSDRMVQIKPDGLFTILDHIAGDVRAALELVDREATASRHRRAA